ncbi:hypothetical protein AVEN_175916-1 [Araneus ventricosus]|uniref:Uncharacterized protein n=1 Tax=Araneus ventricosus TaxID=182803 RepID=A0A4Y2JM39_ARAVE|nr:hypothetical protein AVEN_175916-1 [Araneus ventricosus]
MVGISVPDRGQHPYNILGTDLIPKVSTCNALVLNYHIAILRRTFHFEQLKDDESSTDRYHSSITPCQRKLMAHDHSKVYKKIDYLIFQNGLNRVTL